MKDTQEYLTSKGIHSTQQRIAIMNYLMKHHTHPTVEEIFLALNPKMPTLSRTTVYNTLKLFVQHDAIQTVNLEGENARFDADTDMHAHFHCVRCGAIIDIPLTCLSDLGNLQANPALQNYDIKQTHIDFKGICPSCKTSEK